MSLWRGLECSFKDLQLLMTLSGGQCFRWHRNEEGEWTGVFAQRIWTLKQTDEKILYQVQHATELAQPKTESKARRKKPKGKVQQTVVASNELDLDILNDEDEKLLKEYFRLDFPLEKMYAEWSQNDPNFKEVASKFHGVRMLKQDPVENIFSFICSSNNNIARISSMVERMCTLYGKEIGEKNGQVFYAFPDINKLSDPTVELDLRKASFGYRAKFIQKSAEMIQSLGGETWLQSLQTKPYSEAKAALMQLPGIGAKVADCICLMSFNHLEAIPVDTHVWQISCRYLPHLKNYKSVTEKVYNEIGDYFRKLYGLNAGWAHTVLFCADLKMFQEKPSGAKKRKAKIADGDEKQQKSKRLQSS